MHTKLTITSHVNPPVTKYQSSVSLQCVICKQRVLNLNYKSVSCVTRNWGSASQCVWLMHQIPRHSGAHLQDMHSSHQMKPHRPVKHTKHYKSHQNCCILFRSYCCVIWTSWIMAAQPKHDGHGQNSLPVICKFGAIRWSALLHLPPLNAQWNTNV
jgi:hypothetical protein